MAMHTSRSRWLLAGAVACGAAGVVLPRGLPALPPLVATALVGLGIGLAFAALLAWQLPDACDAAPAALRRRYAREIGVAMGAYVVVLVVSLTLLKRLDLAPAVRALVALMPVPAIAMSVRAMIRYIRDVDEMQQRIELEAISLATALVCLSYMTGGFLQAAKVIDIPAAAAMIWVFPLVCAAYGLVKAVVARRYR